MKKLLAIAVLLGLGVSVSGCAQIYVYPDTHSRVDVVGATIVKIDPIAPSYLDRLIHNPRDYWISLKLDSNASPFYNSSKDYDFETLVSVRYSKELPLTVGQKVKVKLTTKNILQDIIP